MSARLFGYYDNWRDETLTCPQCSWSGTFKQGSMEVCKMFAATSCPHCKLVLAEVSYPTIEESRENWNVLTEPEKRQVEAVEKLRKLFTKECLKSADQLPDVAETNFAVSWDFIEEDSGPYTLIKLKDQVLWKEPATYEGENRFEEIAGFLKAKYGSKITDLIPTGESGYYLYGDSHSSIETVDRVRASFKS